MRNNNYKVIHNNNNIKLYIYMYHVCIYIYINICEILLVVDQHSSFIYIDIFLDTNIRLCAFRIQIKIEI